MLYGFSSSTNQSPPRVLALRQNVHFVLPQFLTVIAVQVYVFRVYLWLFIYYLLSVTFLPSFLGLVCPLPIRFALGTRVFLHFSFTFHWPACSFSGIGFSAQALLVLPFRLVFCLTFTQVYSFSISFSAPLWSYTPVPHFLYFQCVRA